MRKRAKEEDERGGDVEDDMDDGADKAAAKGRKTMVKLPWEVLTPFSDFLRGMPNRPDDDDEEDEDEAQAYQDSMQRLRVGRAPYDLLVMLTFRMQMRSRRR